MGEVFLAEDTRLCRQARRRFAASGVGRRNLAGAVHMAQRSDAKEVAAQYAAEQALRIVFWSSGRGFRRVGKQH